MNYRFITIFFSFLSFLLSLGCMQDPQMNQPTEPLEAYIKLIRLGQIKRNIPIKTNGKDSIITQVVDAKSIPFAIDQESGEIFNAVPLPYGTNLSSITLSALEVYGYAFLKNLDNEDETIIQLQDTIDCKQTRTINVYSSFGPNKQTRIYYLKLNVKPYNEETWIWEKHENPANLQAYDKFKLLTISNQFYLYAQKGSETSYFAYENNDWEKIQTYTTPINLESLCAFNQSFYSLTQHKILKVTADFLKEITPSTAIKHLIGSTSQALYALSTSNELMSSEDGQTWQKEPLTEGVTIPKENLQLLSIPSLTKKGLNRLILIGTDNHKTIILHKDEAKTIPNTFKWFMLQSDYNNHLLLSLLKQTKIVSHNRDLLTFDLDNHSFKSSISKDLGLTWKPNTDYTLPDSLPQDLSNFTTNFTKENWIFYFPKAKQYYIATWKK